jgi:voltage-dependent anion channel protein 2
MGLTKYSDFGKKASDTLGSDYYSYDRKLTVKSKTSSGVSFKAEGAVSGKDGPISGKFTGGFKPFDGVEVKKLTLSSKSRLGVEASLKGVADGLTFTVVTDSGFDVVPQGLTVKADYSTSAFTVNNDINVFKSAVKTSASFGFGDFLVGGMVQYEGDVKDFNAGLSYSGGDFSANLETKKKMSTVSAGYFQKLNSDINLAATVSAKLADPSSASLAVGCVYNVDSESEVASKIDSAGVLSLGYNQKITKGIKLGASAEINAAKFESDDHKLGLNLSFE